MVLGYNESMSKVVYTLFLLFCYSSEVMAIDYRWTGLGSSSVWSDSGNWSPSGIPGPIDRVLFDSGAIESVMDRDFSILRLETTSGYSGTLRFGAFNLNINEAFDVQTYGGQVETDSLTLVFVGPSSILAFEGLLKLKGMTSLGHTIRGSASVTGINDTLRVTNSFLSTGQIQVEEVHWFQSGATFDHTGTIVALTDEEQIHLEMDTIQNLGSLDIQTHYSALSNFISPGQYLKDLSFSTRGAVDTVSLELSGGNYQIGGDLIVLVDSLYDFPLILEASSSSAFDISGSWNSYSQSELTNSKISMFLDDAQMTLGSNLSLMSLDSQHVRFFSDSGLLILAGDSGTISIDTNNSASFASVEIQSLRRLDIGELILSGNASSFDLNVGVELEVSALGGVTATERTTVNILGDMKGEGLLTLVTLSPITFPDTLRIATQWSEYVYSVPGAVYTQPFKALLDSEIRQMTYRFEDSVYEFQEGLEFLYTASAPKHIIDFATSDPIVRVYGPLKFLNNSVSVNPIIVWSEIPLEFYGDTISFEGLDEVVHGDARMRILGSDDVVLIPAVDTIPGIVLESDVELNIEGRDLIVGSYLQTSGSLNLTFASIIVENDLTIVGDSTSLLGLNSRTIEVGGDATLTGRGDSPIKISSVLEHTWLVDGTIQADSAQIGNSRLQVSSFGQANSSENLGGNRAWNFSQPTGVELGVDSLNEGQVAPVFVGLLRAIDSLDDAGNDDYTYTISSALEDRDNSKFSIVEDSLFLNEIPDVEVQLDYLLGVRVVDQTGASAESALDLKVRDSVLFIAQNITQTSRSQVEIISIDSNSRQFYRSTLNSSDTLPIWLNRSTTLNYELSFDSTETLKDTSFQVNNWTYSKLNDSTLSVQNQLNNLGLDSIEIDFPLSNGADFKFQQFVEVVESPFLADTLAVLNVMFKGPSSFYSSETDLSIRPQEIWIQLNDVEQIRSVDVTPSVPVRFSKNWLILETPTSGSLLELSLVSKKFFESSIEIQIPEVETIRGAVIQLENWHSAQKVYTIEGRQHQGWLNEGFFYVP